MDRSPGDERPAGAVPESADQHRQHQVSVREEPTAAVAAERDVDVVAQPARERHVPATPEVLDRHRRIRGVEVLREAEAEEEREPDRHVRVPAEVGVDLDRVSVDPDERLERRMLVGCPEDRVDDRGGEVVGDDDLLEEAGPDEEEGPRRVDVAWIAGSLELREELSRPHDRACHEMGEEGEIRGELPEADRLPVAAVRVHDVADRHEREERDPDREDDRADRQRNVEPDEREDVVRR